ncbi:hypothetical protein EIP91_008369 [Steccherinum ochraceum]|uniref:Uncharacterized protein n=1 Tax=Steccherinum ochraceum TaxID=92696 RepID=A0A4R0R5Q3_9APHY|nr:hypothetical protein EIP91_008369 [Steccherinum ochraceum]
MISFQLMGPPCVTHRLNAASKAQAHGRLALEHEVRVHTQALATLRSQMNQLNDASMTRLPAEISSHVFACYAETMQKSVRSNTLRHLAHFPISDRLTGGHSPIKARAVSCSRCDRVGTYRRRVEAHSSREKLPALEYLSLCLYPRWKGGLGQRTDPQPQLRLRIYSYEPDLTIWVGSLCFHIPLHTVKTVELGSTGRVQDVPSSRAICTRLPEGMRQ